MKLNSYAKVFLSTVFLAVSCGFASCGSAAPAGEETRLATTYTSAISDAESAVESSIEPVRKEAVLLAVGDLMVHGEQLRAAYDAQTGGYDFSGSFAHVLDDISGADLAIGNLETVLAGEEAGYSDYPRFNAPDSFARALGDAGFDFLTTANNHCMDMGEAGLLRTLETLDNLGLGHTGTFSSPEERQSVAILDVNGIRVALAAFTYGTNGIPVDHDKSYMVNMLDRETIAAALGEARASGADWIIALPHMGGEYEKYPRGEFVELADYMIACGADMVLACHPHVLQPMEIRTVTGADGVKREALVAYSLGNFLSSQREIPCDAGMMLRLHIARDGGGPAYLEKAEFIPTWVQLRDAGGRLRARVLTVRDAVLDYERGNLLRLLPRDYERLISVHSEATGLYLGHSAGRNGMLREYEFYKR